MFPKMFEQATYISLQNLESFQIQKSKALQQLLGLMGTSKLFDQFMNEKGLPVLLDNIEIRGIDQLKMMVDDWLKELQQQKQINQILQARADLAETELMKYTTMENLLMTDGLNEISADVVRRIENLLTNK